MKKLILVLALLASCATAAFAVTKEDINRSENETAFGNVAVTGSSTTGNPGYIKFSAPNYAGVNFAYYLWIEGSGKVCVASYPTISGFASFPTGNWNDRSGGMSCTVVGGQS